MNMSSLDDNPIMKQCHQIFGRQLQPNTCLALLLAVINSPTTMTTDHQREHTANCTTLYAPDLYERSACVQFEQSLYRMLMPPMLVLCVVGNVLNVLIYRLAYFDGSSAVHFLQIKAIANLLFVCSRLCEMLNACLGVNYSMVAFKTVYWHTRAYMMTLANISGTISTWFTLVVAIETTAAVIRPFNFRQYCTRSATNALLIALLVLSTLLHVHFPLTHTVDTFHTRLQIANDSCYTLVALSMRLRNASVYEMYEKVYYWTQSAVSIVVPTLAMLVCSLLIITNFRFRELGEAFNQRWRRCVIRITAATALSHLLLEGPALVTFVAVAFKGSKTDSHDLTMCMLNASTNFLCILNASIPFYLYLICNEQFRRMTFAYLRRQVRVCGGGGGGYESTGADGLMTPNRSQIGNNDGSSNVRRSITKRTSLGERIRASIELSPKVVTSIVRDEASNCIDANTQLLDRYLNNCTRQQQHNYRENGCGTTENHRIISDQLSVKISTI